MKISRQKLELAMANACLNPLQVSRQAGCQYATLRNLMNGKEGKPATIGKIAAVLNVPVEKLVSMNVDESGD